MNFIRLSFSPDLFNFNWNLDQMSWFNKNNIAINEIQEANTGDKIYQIIRENEVIYYGKIETNIYAKELFRNLGI
jgi:hypothetical protein